MPADGRLLVVAALLAPAAVRAQHAHQLEQPRLGEEELAGVLVRRLALVEIAEGMLREAGRGTAVRDEHVDGEGGGADDVGAPQEELHGPLRRGQPQLVAAVALAVERVARLPW